MTEHQPYEKYNGEWGVKISYILTDRGVDESVGLMSYVAYKLRSHRKKDFRLKQGKGAGNEALVRYQALNREEQSVLKDKFGEPAANYHPLEKHFEIDGAARLFYDTYTFGEHGSRLTEKQKKRYTLRASVLNALSALKDKRFTDRKKKNNSSRGVWKTLISDVHLFEERCIHRFGYGHGLPNSDKLRQKLNEYLKNDKPDYTSLIDGRARNQNAQTATPEMIELWKSIYAGQGHYKPNHIEVARTYDKFLAGKATIINNETGEQYDFRNSCYRAVSDRTVKRYQNLWANKIGTHLVRSGDRQKYKSQYIPAQSRKRPEHAGVIISVDDRNSAFQYAAGKRMWYYMGIDVGSEMITAWTWGDTKEGIILDFYRQMVANYHFLFKKNLPYELEGEMSLNSSFLDTFLANGAMFQKVRIEANNARGKIIERFFREIRYRYEKKIEGWRARPHARDEANQQSAQKVKYLSKEEIIEIGKRVISEWNNELHSDQKTHEGLKRWEVFEQKQHPELENYPTNYAGILPHLGYETPTSMHAGKVKLQYKDRWAAQDGQILSGQKLINVLEQIEGKNVVVKWLDKGMYGKGEVIKAIAYKDGKQICELIGDEVDYAHGSLERTEQDIINKKLQDAYQKTVESYANSVARSIDRVTILEEKEPINGGFVMPDLVQYESPTEAVEVLPPAPEKVEELYVPETTRIIDDY